MIHFYFCRKITFKNKNNHKTICSNKPIRAYVAKKKGNKISVLLGNL